MGSTRLSRRYFGISAEFCRGLQSDYDMKITPAEHGTEHRAQSTEHRAQSMGSSREQQNNREQTTVSLLAAQQ
jgi:plasmid maintenance system antidote protein VapI